MVLIASLEIVCFCLIILDRGEKQQWFFYQLFHEIQASILQHGNRFSGWFKRIGARASTGLSLKVSPTSELRKLNVLSKSQQEHRDSSAGAREPETILQANIFCVRMVLSSWLGAEKQIRRVVRGENGLAAGVLVAVSLNVPGHTGYINKNSYGRDCIHLIIYLRERERKRHSQHIPCNIVTIIIIYTVYWKNSSPKMNICLKSICLTGCR